MSLGTTSCRPEARSVLHWHAVSVWRHQLFRGLGEWNLELVSRQLRKYRLGGAIRPSLTRCFSAATPALTRLELCNLKLLELVSSRFSKQRHRHYQLQAEGTIRHAFARVHMLCLPSFLATCLASWSSVFYLALSFGLLLARCRDCPTLRERMFGDTARNGHAHETICHMNCDFSGPCALCRTQWAPVFVNRNCACLVLGRDLLRT